MSWFAVGGAALTAVSGYAKSKSDQKKAKKDQEYNEKRSREDRYADMLGERYTADLEYQQEQRRRKNKERGLAEFRKFNTMSTIAPNYAQDINTGIVVPEIPNPENYLPVDPNAAAAAGGGGSGGGILSKIDPLGAKLIKKDPIGKKLLGGLF